MHDLPDIDELWDFQDPAASEKRFRELLRQIATSLPEASVLELETQIARSLGLQRKFVEADELLDIVDRRLPPGDTRVGVRYLLERGRVRNSSGKRKEALPFFQKALEMAEACGEENLAVDAAHMLAIVAEGDEQLRWNERAIQMAENAVDPKAKKWLASLYNNTGWTHHDKGEYETALSLFEKALDLRQQRGETYTIGIARWCVARALRSLGRIDEALAIQRELESDDSSGFVSEEIAECLMEQGNMQDARQYFKKAYDILAKNPEFVENEKPRLERLKANAEP